MNRTSAAIDLENLTPASIARGDPLLARLTALRLPAGVLGGIYAGAFYAARALAAGLAGHWFTVGGVLGFFEIPAQYTSTLAAAAVMAYYVWLPRGLVAVFKGLARHQVIGAPIPREDDSAGRSEPPSFSRFIADMQTSFGRRRWPVAALLVATGGTFILVLPQYLTYVTTVADVADPLSLALTVLWIWLALYGVLLVLFYSLLAIYWFRHLFTDFVIHVRPLYPDRAGGLSPLGNFTLKLSYLISVIGIMLVLTPITRNYAAERTLQFRWTPEILVGLGVYLVAAPIVFFAPLAVANRAMSQAKDDLLLQIAQRFDDEYRSIQGLLSGSLASLEDKLKALQELQELHAATTRFPVWPFNASNVTRFATSYLSPIVLAVVANWISSLMNWK